MIRLHTLNAASIDVGSWHVGPSSAHAFAALLFLCAERGHPVSRATLHALLFPDSAKDRAHHSVRQLLYSLRGRGVRLIGGKDDVMVAATDVVDDYSQLLSGSVITSDDMDRVTGGFLPGYVPVFSEPFAEWLEQFRSSVTLRICQTGSRASDASAARRLGHGWARRSRVSGTGSLERSGDGCSCVSLGRFRIKERRPSAA